MTRLVVLDTETTGFGDKDQVCEIATTNILLEKKTTKISRWTTLVRPSVPMSIGARATHHITDEMLARAPAVDDEKLLADVRTWLTADVLVAHNLDFDRRMMQQSGFGEVLPKREVCTYRCALHLYPESEGFSNQHIRYLLGLHAIESKLPPHRAPFDAATTAAITLRMLEGRSIEELEKLTRDPVLLHRVRTGKYRGFLWKDLDTGYLQWVLRKFGSDERDALHTARHYLIQRGVIKERPTS